MSNLFENADRYAGGVTYLGLAPDDGFVITVDDNGPGIAEEDRDRIFERFWRGAAARGHTSSGTGLGLSLCRSTPGCSEPRSDSLLLRQEVPAS